MSLVLRTRIAGGASVPASRLVSSLAPPNRASAALTRLALVLSILGLTGCATRVATPTDAQFEAIRVRSEARFERAIYLKPTITNSVPTDAEKFAPLLIIEAAGASVSAAAPDVDLPREIFFHSGRIQLNGLWHEQKTYWWNYPRRAQGSLTAQGVRITLNSAGSPAIWEALADTSGAQVIFVSQSVEAQASREFGAAQGGRRFAVERALNESPRTVVARVIEDGPMPMGPIIYLRGDKHDVTTAICRCMDSQARELAGQLEYRLTMDRHVERKLSTSAPLDSLLRLPKAF